MKDSILLALAGSLVLSVSACAPERLSTGDTCIELNSSVTESFSMSALPSPEHAAPLENLAERASEVLADELKLLGELAKESHEDRERRFLIDAQYENVESAVAMVNGACK